MTLVPVHVLVSVKASVVSWSNVPVVYIFFVFVYDFCFLFHPFLVFSAVVHVNCCILYYR